MPGSTELVDVFSCRLSQAIDLALEGPLRIAKQASDTLIGEMGVICRMPELLGIRCCPFSRPSPLSV